MADWCSMAAHDDFRLFLSGEPGIIPPLPINLLMICLKLNNEPPEGLKPNLLKAMIRFDDGQLLVWSDLA